jgi:flagellar motor switch protein FliM
MHTQFANIANPSDAVVVMGIRVEIGEKSIGGTIQICIPYASLESIRDILYSTMQGDQAEPDKHWINTMAESIHNTNVTIKANLAKATLSIGDIARLRVGDVIALEIPEILTATINNVPAFSCKFGSNNEKNALKVEQMMLKD